MPDLSLRYPRLARLIKTEANQARFSSFARGYLWSLTEDEGRKTTAAALRLRSSAQKSCRIADYLYLHLTSPPAGPTAAQLRRRPARWPERAITGHHHRAHVCRHTAVCAHDARVERRAIQ